MVPWHKIILATVSLHAETSKWVRGQAVTDAQELNWKLTLQNYQ